VKKTTIACPRRQCVECSTQLLQCFRTSPAKPSCPDAVTWVTLTLRWRSGHPCSTSIEQGFRSKFSNCVEAHRLRPRRASQYIPAVGCSTQRLMRPRMQPFGNAPAKPAVPNCPRNFEFDSADPITVGRTSPAHGTGGSVRHASRGGLRSL
jgi:hypothetical protein